MRCQDGPRPQLAVLPPVAALNSRLAKSGEVLNDDRLTTRLAKPVGLEFAWGGLTRFRSGDVTAERW